MLKRSGFKREPVPRAPKAPLKPLAEAARASLRRADGSARLTVAIPKRQPLQHERYMRAVRQLSCAHCGRHAPSQFCHSDEGKGTALKSDCRQGWPGCGPHGESPGCHYLIGTQRIYPKAQRRALEAEMARQTRQRIKDLGQWPANLEWID